MATFPERTIDVMDAGAAEAAARTLSASRELAVDVEADAMHAFHARLCFVQLGTDTDVFVFDTLAPGVDSRILAPQFADPSVRKYFHAAGGDLQYLAEAGVRVRGLFDTHRAATLLGWAKVGLADLAREQLAVELPKEHQQADFSLRPLPPQMHAYIADDVRYLCEIGRRVHRACEEADILEEVLLDCERMSDEATVRPDLADFRPKLPKGSLAPSQYVLAHHLAVELHRRRLQWAEAANVPMGRMLSNAALTSIASRPPASLKELQRAEGVRGAFVREHGEEVLALVRELILKARAGELTLPEEKKGDRDPNRRKREDSLKTFRAQKAAERKVTPSVVLSNPLVEALSREPPAHVEALRAIPYFGEKRIRLYGEALVTLLKP